MRLVFAGTPAFARRALAALHDAGHEIALVLTQPDRPAGRGQRPVPSPVKRFASEHGLAVVQPESLASPGVLDRIRDAHPAVLVVAAYGALLPAKVLEAAPQGALNIHASLLPRWRGAAPIQRALLAGDGETGISIMKMDRGLDTGPVLAQRSIAIAADDDAGTLHDKLASLGADMILEALTELEAGRSRAVAQPQAGVSYARKVAKEEAVLDWTRPAAELERTIRAFRPSPGASSVMSGAPLKIWRARCVDEHGAPGSVIRVGADAFVVACGKDALEIAEVQRSGGRRLAAAEFLRGHALAPGARLG